MIPASLIAYWSQISFIGAIFGILVMYFLPRKIIAMINMPIIFLYYIAMILFTGFFIVPSMTFLIEFMNSFIDYSN